MKDIARQKKWKPIAFIVAGLLIVSAFGIGLTSANPATTVSIDDALDVPAGDTAVVSIVIETDDPDGIGSATIELSYDPSVVEVDSVSGDDLGGVTANINNTAGTATLTAATGSSPGPTGTVYFANVTLLAVGSGGDTSPLDLTVTSLYDGSSGIPQAISPTVQDGTFSIAGGALSADADGPYSGVVGDTISFQGSATGGTSPYSYAWDFDNDGTVDSTLEDPTHSYGSPGTYTVTLNVTDDAGDYDVDTTTADISSPPALAADADGPYSGVVGDTISFQGSATGGTSPYSYAWDFDNDGTVDSTLEDPTHNYGSPGTYTVTLNVTDNVGDYDVDTTTADISPITGTTVYIEDGSADPSDTDTVPIIIETDDPQGIGSATIELSYDPTVVEVDHVTGGALGDVTTNIDNPAGMATMTAATGSSPGPTGTVYFANLTLHAVGSPGDTSPLDLTVTSLYDGSSGTPNAISPTVEDGTFTVTGEGLLTADAHGPYSGPVGGTISFEGSATGGTSPYSYAWDFDNDGTVDSTMEDPTHSYGSPDTYTVTLNVTDNVGDYDVDTTTADISLITGTTVNITDGSARPCDTDTIPIIIETDDPQGIGSATIELSYDPTVVEVDGITGDDLGDVTTNIDNPAGMATMTAATGSSPGPTGTVYFANVTLHAVGSLGDTSPLDLTVTSLYDGSSGTPEAISPTVTDGVFSVTQPVETVIWINNASAPPEQTNTTAIMIETNEPYGVGSVCVNLTFDPTVVQVEGVTGGHLGDVTANIDNTNGVVNMTAAIGSSPGPTGTLYYANLTLRAVGVTGDTSPLDLSVGPCGIFDGSPGTPQPITPTVIDGLFTVEAIGPTFISHDYYQQNGPANYSICDHMEVTLGVNYTGPRDWTTYIAVAYNDTLYPQEQTDAITNTSQLTTYTFSPPISVDGRQIATWWCFNATAGNFTFTFPDSCAHAIYYFSQDDLGNREIPRKRLFHVDATPPDTTLEYQGSMYPADDSEAVYIHPATTVILNATDPGPPLCASGVNTTTMQLWWMNETQEWEDLTGWITTAQAASQYAWASLTPEGDLAINFMDEPCGKYQIHYKSTDYCGHERASYQWQDIIVDCHPPTSTKTFVIREGWCYEETTAGETIHYLNPAQPVFIFNATDHPALYASGVHNITVQLDDPVGSSWVTQLEYTGASITMSLLDLLNITEAEWETMAQDLGLWNTTWHVYHHATDNVGNQETKTKQKIRVVNISADNEPPVIHKEDGTPAEQIELGGETVHVLTWETPIYLNVTDQPDPYNASGVASVAVSLDAVTWHDIPSHNWTILEAGESGVYRIGVVITPQWLHTEAGLTNDTLQHLYVKVTDEEGHVAQESKQKFMVDTSPPNVTVTTTCNGTMPFNVTATANDTVPVHNLTLYYRYSPDNATNWTDWTAYDTVTGTDSHTWSFSPDEGYGYYRFYVYAEDELGNNKTMPADGDYEAWCHVPYPPEDLNHDGRVSTGDILMVLDHWGETGDPGWIPEDLSGPEGTPDGVIDIFDVLAILDAWTG